MRPGTKKICKNCGKRIVYKTSSIDDFWSHPHNNLVYCDKTPWEPDATFEETYPIAEPLVKHQFKILGTEDFVAPGYSQPYKSTFIVLQCVWCTQTWRMENLWFWIKDTKPQVPLGMLSCRGPVLR